MDIEAARKRLEAAREQLKQARKVANADKLLWDKPSAASRVPSVRSSRP